MIIPILGMHRSGTSFVARILHGAGVYLGEDLMKADSANLFGHWESWEAVKINDDILQDSGGSWHLPPKEIREAPETAERIRRFLSHFRSKPLASWKDPRTTFTFPLWRRHLKEYFVVAVFRNPVDVAKSLELREGWGFEKGLELWTKYNNRLIENLRDEKNIFWFDYDMPADQIPGTIRVLCEKIGLSFNNDLLKLFNSRLRNYRTSELPQDPGICLLYEELKKRSMSGSLPVEPRLFSKNRDKTELWVEKYQALETGQAELTEIYRGQNIANQNLMIQIKEIEKCTQELTHQNLTVRMKELEKIAWHFLNHFTDLPHRVSQLNKDIEALNQTLNKNQEYLRQQQEYLRQQQEEHRRRQEILTEQYHEQHLKAMHYALEAHQFMTRIRNLFLFRLRRKIVKFFRHEKSS